MYALIHNNQIQVGPRQWVLGAFKEYLQETEDPVLLTEAQTLPRQAPSEILSGSNWKILPVTTIDHPILDPLFEELVGPFWSIHEDHITGLYQKIDAKLENSKGVLKNIVTQTRQKMEEFGFYYPHNSDFIRFATDIKGRSALQMGSPGMWKLKLAPYDLVYPSENVELNQIRHVLGESTIWFDMTPILFEQFKTYAQQHIQNCFNYENTMWATIDAAQNLATLKNLNLTFPTPIFGN